MRCMCPPRSLSIHPRCPIHGNHATNVERVHHGMQPQPRTCPKTWRPCGRVECAAYCAGPAPASGVATDGGQHGN